MVEQSAVNRSVVGSSPTFGATFPKENEVSGEAPKNSPNNTGDLQAESEQNVKFPKRLRHNERGRV